MAPAASIVTTETRHSAPVQQTAARAHASMP
jgi:hypothetical protein